MTEVFGWATDFETYHDEVNDSAWVWAWGACSIDDPEVFEYGNCIESFIGWCLNKKKCYFHNLRFDGSYIIDFLLKGGWNHTTEKKVELDQFSTLISKDNVWYKILMNHDGKHRTAFYDSYKKLPFKVARIAKAFKLEDSKGEMDYKKRRNPGEPISPDDLDYLTKDCRIMANALRIQFQQGLTKMTIGADAMAYYKGIAQDQFKRLWPELPLEVDTFIRQAYKGGYTNMERPGDYKQSICFDVNSLYPYAMTLPLPAGVPVKFYGAYIPNTLYPLYVIRFTADFTLKKGYLPTVQIKGSKWQSDVEWLRDSKHPQTMTMTCVDFALFWKHYDVWSIEYHGGYMFQKVQGVFDEYINYWGEIKAQYQDGPMRELAKLMLNNLYGKFSKNPDVTCKYPVLEDQKIKMRMGEYEQGATVYIPVGAFITANARNITIRSGQQCYDRFIYSDTDSLHLAGDTIPTGIEVHNSRLGAWKLEYISDNGRYTGAKKYIVVPRQTNGRRGFHAHCTCAGMPDTCKKSVRFSNFKDGTVFNGKLVHKIVEGGAVLEETTYTMKGVGIIG